MTFAKGPARHVKILAFGDSLTAGYQLPPAQSYPKQLETLLKGEGYDVEIANAGVSGDTSAQALARVDWNLKQGPYEIVLLAIGANDGLRLQPVKGFRTNLETLVARFQKHGARVLLLGMRLPTNFDAGYRKAFEKVYADVAKAKKLTFLPFLLEGVATDQMLNLEDQIHPNAQGYAIVAKNVAGLVRPLLAK